VSAPPRVVAFGDAAVLVVLGEAIDPGINAAVHVVAARVRELSTTDPRFGMPVPAYATVLVPIDPLAIDTTEAIERVTELASGVRDAAETAAAGRTIELPTRYGGEDGPDLDEVAERAALTAAQVVELHASIPYRVYMLGFAPGFAYLGRVPTAIAAPRRATPRSRVPAGSVGIAGEQTGVYPFASPGGWQLIGRTDIALWDVSRDPPALLSPGDTVRFVPLTP
jgi:KipI family sensor histidine kinase inhibitor